MRPDFSRDVRCVFGLPFDALTEAQAEQSLRKAIASRTQCFLSTPNLNFAVACQTDAAFRQSVLESDLNIADGWPIVAAARLTGAALPERVAGSSLFERLVASSLRPPVSAYFFGGPDGAAAAACARLNARGGGVVCVGHDSPGFGSVAEISTSAQLERLHSASPDFVVVALGAKKGQAWIRHNLARVNAPVISHLGAVVNFMAGTVSRAPRWVQSARLEWLWRIREEPALWRRYARDAAALARMLATRVVPFAIDQWLARRDRRSQAASVVRSSVVDGGVLLTLEGGWSQSNLDAVRPLLTAAFDSGGGLSIDLGAVTRIDSALIGLLALAQGAQVRTGRRWRIVAASTRAARSLRLAGAGYLLESG